MKRLLLIVVGLLFTLSLYSQQSSKIIYSNAMTHFYVTVVTDNNNRYFAISETSDRKVWRMWDRSETQILYTFNETEINDFLEAIIKWYPEAKKNDSFTYKDVIQIQKTKKFGITCITLTNLLSTANFNTDIKSIKGAFNAINNL